MPKVLLVEDDNNLREIFQMRLQAEGYSTVTAADGEEGLVVAMKEKPDLIIADVMMPKLSGFEMIENLRAAPEMKDTKVVMMTALGQDEDQARGEKLGVVKYLVKSQVTLEDFARVVKEVLGPGNPQDTAAAKQVVNQSNNNQESENNMPPADQTPTNPMPDPSAPAEPSMPSPAPMGDSGQQSTDDEQKAVDQQVNDFAASPPAEPAAAPSDEPASPEPMSMPAEPAAAPSDMGAPSMPPATDPPSMPEPSAPAEPGAPAGGEQPGGDSMPHDPTSNAL